MFQHNPGTRASQAQRDLLTQMGISGHPWLSASKADRLIKENQEKWAKLPATEKQIRFLTKRGAWRPGIHRKEAFDLIARMIDRREERDRAAVRPGDNGTNDGAITSHSPSSNKGISGWGGAQRACERRRDLPRGK